MYLTHGIIPPAISGSGSEQSWASCRSGPSLALSRRALIPSFASPRLLACLTELLFDIAFFLSVSEMGFWDRRSTGVEIGGGGGLVCSRFQIQI